MQIYSTTSIYTGWFLLTLADEDSESEQTSFVQETMYADDPGFYRMPEHVRLKFRMAMSEVHLNLTKNNHVNTWSPVLIGKSTNIQPWARQGIEVGKLYANAFIIYLI